MKNFILFSNLTLAKDRTYNLMLTGESPTADYSIVFHSRWWDQQCLAPIPYDFWCNVVDKTTMSTPCVFEKKSLNTYPLDTCQTQTMTTTAYVSLFLSAFLTCI